MKILHVCMHSYFTEGMSYQENLLAAQNAADGHDVHIITDCFHYDGGNIVEVPPVRKVIADGINLIRLPIVNLVPSFLTHKIKLAPGLYNEIEHIVPDVILYHGVVGSGLLALKKYKDRHPEVKIYVDSHEDYNNSGRNIISRVFQYKLLTRALLARVNRSIEKFLYVSYESRDFLRDMYHLNEDRMEFYPLGGDLPDEAIRAGLRQDIRQKMALDDKIVFVHSGKLDKGKKTQDILRAFRHVSDPRFALLVIGSIPEAEHDAITRLMEADSRIIWLGWVNSTDLKGYLCAADVYLQPGTQSVTLQVAMCCSSSVVIHPYFSHRPYLNGNGFYVESESDLQKTFEAISENPQVLSKMGIRSQEIAKDLLDYRKLAARLYH
ncbi:glycosyltransferase family 4 protein [Yersinia ruckeri]|nr:glycosyltransferase family 4 protein [Yersinia ruckeri]EKN4201444.1 glycosyltransferase family 4 protein [Yersinia ruckeri]EKN4208317.1 glycosyltransferase family 4 protein [Yersinia ruckeri]EKN4726076.1 glycosyltransferase family 4 protein [Yersinia ruckeri]ELV7519127.1 glycosyltransferase family 4 protein [Yersinia ruckeri]